jgi:hypothetical protein
VGLRQLVAREQRSDGLDQFGLLDRELRFGLLLEIFVAVFDRGQAGAGSVLCADFELTSCKLTSGRPATSRLGTGVAAAGREACAGFSIRQPMWRCSAWETG